MHSSTAAQRLLAARVREGREKEATGSTRVRCVWREEHDTLLLVTRQLAVWFWYVCNKDAEGLASTRGVHFVPRTAVRYLVAGLIEVHLHGVHVVLVYLDGVVLWLCSQRSRDAECALPAAAVQGGALIAGKPVNTCAIHTARSDIHGI